MARTSVTQEDWALMFRLHDVATAINDCNLESDAIRTVIRITIDHIVTMSPSANQEKHATVQHHLRQAHGFLKLYVELRKNRQDTVRLKMAMSEQILHILILVMHKIIGGAITITNVEGIDINAQSPDDQSRSINVGICQPNLATTRREASDIDEKGASAEPCLTSSRPEVTTKATSKNPSEGFRVQYPVTSAITTPRPESSTVNFPKATEASRPILNKNINQIASLKHGSTTIIPPHLRAPFQEPSEEAVVPVLNSHVDTSFHTSHAKINPAHAIRVPLSRKSGTVLSSSSTAKTPPKTPPKTTSSHRVSLIEGTASTNVPTPRHASKAPREPMTFMGYDSLSPSGSPAFRRISADRLQALAPVALSQFVLDAVFISIDIEGVVRNKDISELGLSLFDARDAAGKIIPDIRGQGFFNLIHSDYYVPTDYPHFRQADKPDNCIPDRFAFGQSGFIEYKDVTQLCRNYMQAASTRNLQSEETKRFVIVCSFASELEESILNLYETDWSINASRYWDVQMTDFAEARARRLRKWKPSLEDVVSALGIDTGNRLLHNGGNDAVFTLQALIAGALLTNQEFRDIKNGIRLSRLPKTYDESKINSNKRRLIEERTAERCRRPSSWG